MKTEEESIEELKWIEQFIGDIPLEDRWDIGYRAALKWVLEEK